MAEPNVRRGYPMLSPTNWWAIRGRFIKTMPATVDAAYIHTILNITQDTARKNILPPLRTVGLIDAAGKPTQLAIRWRDDKQYSDVCAEIMKAIYPVSLLDAVPDPLEDKKEAERWFSANTGAGQAAATKMTVFYALLSEGDPLKGQEGAKANIRRTPTTAKSPTGKTIKKPQPHATTQSAGGDSDGGGRGTQTGMNIAPAFHFNVQIHISPDASVQQIDQIFASMAKHLRDLGMK